MSKEESRSARESVALREVKQDAVQQPQDSVCTTRKRHRRGRRETAVKVYTVCRESRALVVENISSFGDIADVMKMFSAFGPLEQYRVLDEWELDDFTDAALFVFKALKDARLAKRRLDGSLYVARHLNVYYTTYLESESDTLGKLEERQRTVGERIDRLRRSPLGKDGPPAAVVRIEKSRSVRRYRGDLPLVADSANSRATTTRDAVSMVNETIERVRKRLKAAAEDRGVLSKDRIVSTKPSL